MQWNWQLTDWPNWQFDSQKMTALEAEFMLTAGRLLDLALSARTQ